MTVTQKNLLKKKRNKFELSRCVYIEKEDNYYLKTNVRAPATTFYAYLRAADGMQAEGAIRHLSLKLSASKTPTAPSQNAAFTSNPSQEYIALEMGAASVSFGYHYNKLNTQNIKIKIKKGAIIIQSCSRTKQHKICFFFLPFLCYN